MSVLVALMLVVLTFDFVTPMIELTSSAAVIGLLLGSWLVGALFTVVEADGAGAGRRWGARLRRYAAITLGVWGAYVLFQQWWIRATPAGLDGAEHLASLVVLRDGVLFAVIGGRPSYRPCARGPVLSVTTAARWRAAACLVVLGGAAYVALRTNVDLSRADAVSRQAFAAERQRRWGDARQLYEVAQRWQPGSDRNAGALARPLMELARTAGGIAEREGFYGEARAALERAQRLNPLDADHVRNLARLDRLQASTAADDTSRAALLHDGRRALRAAGRDASQRRNVVDGVGLTLPRAGRPGGGAGEARPRGATR